MEYIPVAKIKAELLHYFQHQPDPEYITFSGSGEPTLNSGIGEIMQFIRQIRPAVPVAVLTNGTLLLDKNVRDSLKGADVVLPSLDAATEDVFRRVNRPVGNCSIDQVIRGLIDFRKAFTGKIWLEVFILPGYNDTESEWSALKEAILKIKPDAVQLNTLDRPGAIPGLRAATREELQKIIDFWDMDRVEIIAASPERKDIQAYRNDLETAIMETLARRPCTLHDLSRFLGLHINEINKYLDVLEAEEKIEAVQLERGIFYQRKNK